MKERKKEVKEGKEKIREIKKRNIESYRSQII